MIRRDLFAVKVYSDVGATKGAWVCELITTDKARAFDHKRFVAQDHTRHFPLVEPKVVHPSQDTVNAFVLVGNEIH
jgi:hypothetical protein